MSVQDHDTCISVIEVQEAFDVYASDDLRKQVGGVCTSVFMSDALRVRKLFRAMSVAEIAEEPRKGEIFRRDWSKVA